MNAIHPMKLIQVDRSTFISMNDQYRIQYTTFKGGKGEWIISVKDGNWMKAIDHATTLPEARAKFLKIAVAA